MTGAAPSNREFFAVDDARALELACMEMCK
jgi:hypothetical protein